MAEKNRRYDLPNTGSEDIPPGATEEAEERPIHLGGGAPGSGAGSIDAAGTPGGGSSFGGLAGTNIGDGAPENADLDDALGDGTFDNEGGGADEATPPYAGHAGGAVGGTPAEDRATGGTIRGGLAPGGEHRGDTTVGTNAPQSCGHSRAEAERIAGRTRKAGR